jgi:dienelactone hydrolase
MKESCCRFGPNGRLAGIITEPEDDRRNGGLVLISAGLVPKAGPFRLYAELARHLATAGLSTLRFDLGGIGDSLRANGSQSLRERTQREVRAAVDHFNERKPGAIVIGGLCSGAEDAFRFAETDPRVTGVVMIDPFAYRTAGWWWRHTMHRASRRVARALGLYRPIRRSAKRAGADQPLVSYQYMAKDESSRILTTLVRRGVRVHFVYTGGADETFNHRAQLRTMFDGMDFRGCVTLDHLPHVDHTQVLAEDRGELVEAIARRLS